MDRLDEAAENVRKVLPNTHIEWVRENVAEKLGVTQEEMARFLAEQEARAEEKARQWLAAKVELCRSKSLEGIPHGDFCWGMQDLDGLLEETEVEAPLGREILWDAVERNDRKIGEMPERFPDVSCPYWRDLGFGVRCEFLEEQAVGMYAEDYEKALAAYGSDEEIEKHFTGGLLLAESIRGCKRVIDALRKEKEQDDNAAQG